MATAAPLLPPESSSREQIPPLETGDRLTRAEFERRYDASPGLRKAELVEGVVYVPSPVKHSQHGNQHFDLNAWLGLYSALTPGVNGGCESSLLLDLDNELQPDALLRILTSHGGCAKISDDGYVTGAPELVAEVAASGVSYDLHVKLNAYRRNGVREYLVWKVLDGQIDWFVLHEGRYDRLPQEAGIYKSQVFPGLWLDATAMVRGDMATVMNLMQQGLQSPKHNEFVRRLEQAAANLNKPA